MALSFSCRVSVIFGNADCVLLAENTASPAGCLDGAGVECAYETKEESSFTDRTCQGDQETEWKEAG